MGENYYYYYGTSDTIINQGAIEADYSGWADQDESKVQKASIYHGFGRASYGYTREHWAGPRIEAPSRPRTDPGPWKSRASGSNNTRTGYDFTYTLPGLGTAYAEL